MSFNAMAADTVKCVFTSAMFSSIATHKNLGVSPDETFQIAKQLMVGQNTTDESIKKAVNLVYFNDAFSYSHPEILRLQVFDLCMRDWKPQYEPLK
jgi:hypothetical protein